jgi:tRNA-specific 2-thiouridylase
MAVPSSIATLTDLPALSLGRTIAPGTRILVAMSGGVDSALAATLLQRAGLQVVGVNMRTYHPTAAEKASGRKFQTCCSPEDAADARAVADAGDFPFYVLDLEKEFHRDVVAPFIADYLAGRTPNPCVLCNNHLKLGTLLDKAHLWGCDYVATGHYARIEENAVTGRVDMRMALDLGKDQTYYLFGLRQDQLRKMICPLGEMTKPVVRGLSRELGLEVHDKPDSMEICFVPGNDYREFLRSRVGEGAIVPGAIVTEDGRVLGQHGGVALFTVGQRKGLGITAAGGPWFVVDLLPEENLVVVGPEDATLAAGLVMERTNWIAREAPALGEEVACQARIRHRHTPAAATVRRSAEGMDRFEVRFEGPQRSVTRGQACVLYDGDRTLGGGWIVEPLSRGFAG